ncbi:MAG TPA: hypothetical protein VFC03_21655 [Acidimicrobiales bacterium]|nr:hypothetical protein [Acidimicrobiales bacterium]
MGERTFRYWITAEPDFVHRVTQLLSGPVPTAPDAVVEEFDGGVTLRAAAASLHVEIPPIGGPMVRVLDRSGVEVGAVGGWRGQPVRDVGLLPDVELPHSGRGPSLRHRGALPGRRRGGLRIGIRARQLRMVSA